MCAGRFSIGVHPPSRGEGLPTAHKDCGDRLPCDHRDGYSCMRIVARCSRTRAGRAPRWRGNGHAQAVGRLYMHGRRCTPQHNDNGWVRPALQRGLPDRFSAWLRGAARARPLSQTIEKQTPVPFHRLPFRIRPKNQYRRWRPLAKAMRYQNRKRASHAGNGVSCGPCRKGSGDRPFIPSRNGGSLICPLTAGYLSRSRWSACQRAKRARISAIVLASSSS